MSLKKNSTVYFPWRGWAFCCGRKNKELFTDYVNEAVLKAKNYGVNIFEFHDYTCPGGIVDAVITYRDFNRLKPDLSESLRLENYAYLRGLAKKVKNQDLELNCWYHVFRDAPRTLAEDYPEIRDIDNALVWKFVAASIDEFFDLMPEVDRLTLTSLHETPSIMNSDGSMSREDRLWKLYKTIYDTCRSHGKGLVIRDFITKYEDFKTFWSIIDKLPNDIIIMTKEVLADWAHLGLPLNPYLVNYKGRNLVIEMDLYGEYWGRLDMPCCIPEYTYRVVREILPFDPLGVTARVVHDSFKSHHFKTIFDSPNDVNVYALSKFLQDPGYQLGPGRPWYGDYGQMDGSLWMDWAISKYGKKAAALVVKVLRRTKDIVRLTFDAAGLYDQVHSRLPRTLNQEHFVWFEQKGFCSENRLDKMGIETLRNEKAEALHLAEHCLADIEEAAEFLKPSDYSALKALFEGVVFIIKAFSSRLEMAYFRKEYRDALSKNQNGIEEKRALVTARSDAEKLAYAIRAQFGEKFYNGISGTLKELTTQVDLS